MPIVTKGELKGYFNNNDVPIESNYVDLIDTLSSFYMYSTSTFKTHISWILTVSHITAVYTLTPAMFGYPDKATALYVLLRGYGVLSTGYVGINNLSSSTNFPIYISTPTSPVQTTCGIVHLDASGNMLLRVGTVTAYVLLQVWGYFM